MSAQPISSMLIEKKYQPGVSPATIRNEMQKLTDNGFISQPHTSAGRIPTDKGYRFFVDSLFSGKNKGFKLQKEDVFGNGSESWEIEDTFKIIHSLTKKLSEESSSLALSYLFDDKIMWKEGWESLLRAPEFKEFETLSSLTSFLSFFEKDIERVDIGSGLEVFIGEENPFGKNDDFSVIVSKCSFPKDKEGLLAIVGPKRMFYEKNINSMENIINLLNKF